MTLIAKNKIAEYIAECPQARLALMTWLKEYPYREAEQLFSTGEGKPTIGFGSGGSQPGIGDYLISYGINYAAKTVLITWVGSKEEHQLKMDRELKEMKGRNPDYMEKVKIVQLVITPSKRKEINKQEKNKISEREAIVALQSADANENFPYLALGQNLGQSDRFETAADYHAALSRVSTIFSAQPATPEFDELLALLPLIKNYEVFDLQFPSVEVLEIIKSKLDMFGMPADYLAAIVGSEDKVMLFLSGKLKLSMKKLERIYKRLHMIFPVSS